MPSFCDFVWHLKSTCLTFEFEHFNFGKTRFIQMSEKHSRQNHMKFGVVSCVGYALDSVCFWSWHCQWLPLSRLTFSCWHLSSYSFSLSCREFCINFNIILCDLVHNGVNPKLCTWIRCVHCVIYLAMFLWHFIYILKQL